MVEPHASSFVSTRTISSTTLITPRGAVDRMDRRDTFPELQVCGAILNNPPRGFTECAKRNEFGRIPILDQHPCDLAQ
jgi:hypothetical protein